MPHARANQNAHPGLREITSSSSCICASGAALQYVVRLGEPLVVVQLGVGRDLGHVHRARKVRHIAKRPPRGAAGARDALNLAEIDNLVAEQRTAEWIGWKPLQRYFRSDKCDGYMFGDRFVSNLDGRARTPIQTSMLHALNLRSIMSAEHLAQQLS